jgi:hypothetical protein
MLRVMLLGTEKTGRPRVDARPWALVSELLPKTTMGKARTRLVALLAVIVPLIVLLANGERAFDEARALWLRWTNASPVLETVWQGTWKSKGGYTFDFAMQLEVRGNNSASGQIKWQLVGTPANSALAPRTGERATEFVSGRYDRLNGIASIAGYAVSDPTLLALDTYRFQIRPDKVSFVGMTRYRGDWEAEASGTVIVTEKQ